MKRRNAGSKRSKTPAGESSVQTGMSSDHPESVRVGEASTREGTVQLAILTVAIVAAVLGFAVHFLWIGALVLMGILWGVMVAERQQRHGTVKGLAAEMVTTVVDEARGVMEATSGSESGAAPPPSSTGGGHEENR